MHLGSRSLAGRDGWLPWGWAAGGCFGFVAAVGPSPLSSGRYCSLLRGFGVDAE